MNRTDCTRRGFLKTAGLGLAVCATMSHESAADTVSDGREFTFAQICDTQLGFSEYEQDMKAFQQAVRQINELKPSFVVICGDLVNEAGEKSFADFNQIKAGFQVPCYCASGNHDP